MASWVRLLALAAPTIALAQQCPPTPIYSHCDLVFELPAGHPNPYTSVELHAEFRSPRHRTLLMPAFWDGGNRMVIRFTPTGAGTWDFRVTSNVQSFQGKTGSFEATEAAVPGFVRTANVHHFMTEADRKPHLWMGDTSYRFAFLDDAAFQQMADTRATQKFNHLRGLILGWNPDAAKILPKPDQIDPAHFQKLDKRILYLNSKGITVDLILGGDENQLANLLPNWQDRQRYLRYLIARYAPLNITWQGVQEFQEYSNGRQLVREIGQYLAENDPYQHPRTTHTLTTTSALTDDKWMNILAYQSASDDLGAIEHQIYGLPQVNLEFAYENSGAGQSHQHHTDTDTFRKRLWNAAMNGQYVTYGNTGTYGGKKIATDMKHLDSPGAKQMTAFYDFFQNTRYWDLQPYFDVDNGRALALESIEYIVYLEKPGPVEVVTEKKSYNVIWFNPITGESVREKKEYKGERFSGAPPDTNHDWVLHLSRDDRKKDMLESYKFEARRVLLQEVEMSPEKLPFEIELPSDPISLAKPTPFSAKLKRQTRATRAMRYLWTVEVSAEGQGSRVLGTGAKGEGKIPANIATKFPAVLLLRLSAMNANGKVYQTDRVYQLTQ